MRNLFVALTLVLTLLVAGTVNAACTTAFPTQAKGLMLSGAFQKSHTYKAAFYTSTAAFDATTAAYTATNEVSGTGYTAGGFTLSGLTYGTSGTTQWIDFADLSASNVTFSAASTCVMIYDDTLANSSCTAAGAPYQCCTGSTTGTCTDAALYVGAISSTQPTAGTLTGTFPTPDATNAIVRIQ